GAEEERARYWRARALLEPDPTDTEAGRAAASEAARADLIWLVEERPLTYHGLLARGRLAQLDPARARAIDEAETKEVASGLRGLLRHTSAPLALRAAGLAYPLAFRDQIAKASKTAAIPPDLLQALMREESALDPRALSPTGALGLTQVMPGTAREIARRLKLHGFVPSNLFDPDVSIRIGGAYLGELYARFQHPALALAS